MPFRHCLWILGNERTLVSSVSVWETLVHDAKNRQCFFYADEDKDLVKAIIDVKKEFDQFDDLLNGDSILFKRARWKVFVAISIFTFHYILFIFVISNSLKVTIIS
jgi:hypothetical protein